MKKIFYTLLAVLGMVALFTGCEEDGTRIVMLDNPLAPEFVSFPDMTLVRDNAGDTLIFTATPVDPGFTASATYFIEVCESGNDFADIAILWTGVLVEEIKITVGDANAALKKSFPTDATTSLDYRLRSVLIVDAGSGALGTSSNPLEYISQTTTSATTIYGFPRLDLNNSGKTQKVESPLGNGVYSGIVKMDPAQAFTLTDPDASVNYGGAAGLLAVDGAAITPPAEGYHVMDVDLNAMTYEFTQRAIGLIGSATPNEWNTPDQKMEYDQASGTWSITLDLVVGEIKFRMNDGWAWNLGGTPASLVHDGANLPITVAGNYTVTLTVTDYDGELASCTIVQNN
ncbi:MAG: SusE domain-containing protein [Marinilabiliaceae bacterium]|nr:SusE domain-containing protein [Marinilabiliaceae bacterium]